MLAKWQAMPDPMMPEPRMATFLIVLVFMTVIKSVFYFSSRERGVSATPRYRAAAKAPSCP
jgi:hypothetical protein